MTAVFCLSTIVLFKSEETVSYLAGMILCFGMVSGILDFAGFALLVIATAKLKASFPLVQLEGTIICGVFMAVFLLISAVTNCAVTAFAWGYGVWVTGKSASMPEMKVQL